MELVLDKLAATVILYQPDLDKVLLNIQTFHPEIDYLIVVVNSCLEPAEKVRLENQLPNSSFIYNNVNQGIAKALNQAAEEALTKGYEWLLTMDQDSSFIDNSYFEQFKKSDKREIAIFAPETSDTPTEKMKDSGYETPLTVITSGSIINLKIWKEIGGFNEKLFIDEVDHDYCLRTHLNGRRILKFGNIRINHHLGNSRIANFCGKKIRVYWHKPARTYFIVRNNLYMFSTYAKHFPDYITQRKRILFTDLIKTLLFGEEKYQQLWAMIRAYRHYRSGDWIQPGNL